MVSIKRTYLTLDGYRLEYAGMYLLRFAAWIPLP